MQAPPRSLASALRQRPSARTIVAAAGNKSAGFGKVSMKKEKMERVRSQN
jgi:hypothetical protein